MCINQGSPEKQKHTSVYLYMYIVGYRYKIRILAHAIMEADKSQYLQDELASLRPGEPMV